VTRFPARNQDSCMCQIRVEAASLDPRGSTIIQCHKRRANLGLGYSLLAYCSRVSHYGYLFDMFHIVTFPSDLGT
jgi:hypothetical protein